MKLKELAEMILRFNETEGLTPAALGALKNFAPDALEACGPNSDMIEYQIFTTISESPFVFVGKYRRDLETNNWHYYEKENGEICHFRKEHMVAVSGDTAESIKAGKAD